MTSPVKNIFLHQNEIERKMIDLGKARFNKEISEAVKKAHESTTPGGLQLLNGGLKAVYEGLVRAKAEYNRGAPVIHSALAYKVLDYLPLEVIAFLAFKVCINYLSVSTPVQRIALEIGTALEDEYRFRNFKKENPALFGVILRDLNKKTTNYRKQKNVLIHSAGKAEIDIGKFPGKAKIRVGTFLIDLIVATTGIFETRMINTGGKRQAIVFQAVDKTMDWLTHKNTIFSLLSPVKLPSVLYPRPWTGVYNGGYYTFQIPLIKTGDTEYLKTCTEYIDKGAWKPVLDALNTIQKTAWKINPKILEVMEYYVETGIDIPVLPSPELIPIESYPNGFPSTWEKQDIINWKRKTGKIHEQNVRLKTKKLQLSQLLWTAGQYRNEEKFYFPHSLDFRGRVYPSSAFLNPQGEDTGRSLLLFSESKILGTEGHWWLGIHGANCYGYDKVSLQSRYEWAIQNENDIQRSASDPIEHTFWMGADKPWQFLAFCFEWGRCSNKDSMSDLPVQVDGSCNGLQHFSAMCRDARGGEAVNLLRSDTPSDIYEIVSDSARTRNRSSAWDGKISRGLVKRPVMTTPYGATVFGMREQILSELKHMRDKGIDLGFDGDMWAEANDLAKTVWGAIGDTLVSAREIMTWLQECAKRMEGDSIYWHVPTGFLIKQRYLRPARRRIATILNGKISQLTLVHASNKSNTRKHVNAISPNLVHSLDACHLMLTVNKAKERGIEDFMVVHDSFGTHAGNIPVLVDTLRETFHEMYTKENILDGIHNELRWQTDKELPKPPPMGDLDMDEVLKSEFFFA